MRCNGLPNAYEPGDLRKYIHMWQLETDRHNENEQNWLLKTDERTILTQNRNVENATRVHLQQQQPILGDLYAKRTYDVLGVGSNRPFHCLLGNLIFDLNSENLKMVKFGKFKFYHDWEVHHI